MLTACGQTTVASTPTNSSAPTIILSPVTSSTPTISNSPTQSQVYGLLTSPDGTKKIQSSDWNNYEILTSDGVKLWSFTYENKFGAAEPAAIPIHWSKDGKHIYITCAHGPDDSSTKFLGEYLAMVIVSLGLTLMTAQSQKSSPKSNLAIMPSLSLLMIVC